MPRVRAIALGALLGSAQARGLRRLGQMHPRADPTQLLDHEPPAGRRLQRDFQLLAAEALEKAPHANAVSRRNSRALDLAGLRIQPVGGDLCSMLIKSHQDAHPGASSRSTVSTPTRTRSAHELRRSLHVGSDGLLMTSFRRFRTSRANSTALARLPMTSAELAPHVCVDEGLRT